MDPKRIVILGGGNAGMILATSLRRKVDKSIATITIVDKDNYFQSYGSFHLICTGFLSVEESVFPIEQQLRGYDIEFINSRVMEILPTDSEVKLADSTIHYDFLIVALGSMPNYYEIDGAKQFTIPLKSIDNALEIKTRISSFLTNNKQYDVIIVGAGPTGISVATTISELLDLKYVRSNVKITIIEATSSVLPLWDDSIKDLVLGILSQKGIRTIFDHHVIKIDQRFVYLDNGDSIPTSLTIWAAGNQGSNILSRPQLIKSKNNRIIVDEFCRSVSFDNIFAIGDISLVNNNDGESYPQTSVVAVTQARYLSEAISDYLLNGKKVEQKFSIDINERYIPIGVGHFVASFYGVTLSGARSETLNILESLYQTTGKKEFRNAITRIKIEDITRENLRMTKFKDDLKSQLKEQLEQLKLT